MTAPLVSVRSLTRRYPGVLAMNGVSLDIFPGEVIGLVGKNGAGKSTLIRMLSGVERPDEGHISIDGHDVGDNYNAKAAHRHGLAFMHQELANVRQMSVAENVVLGSRMPRRLGVLVDWSRLSRDVSKVLAELELDVTPETLVADLTPVQQRMVMIARALYHKARLLVLDEPSTSLTDTEIAHLHRVVGNMRSAGRSVVYISHRLSEIIDITDRVIVMQDGRVTATHKTSDIDLATIVTAITGTAAAPAQEGTGSGLQALPDDAPVALRVRNLSRASVVRSVSFDVKRGEILGIAGLVGAGRTELARLLAGVDWAHMGEVEVDGKVVHLGSPRDAVRAGIVLLPEDRRHQGLVLGMSVRENITLASLHSHASPGVRLLSRASEQRVADDYIRQLAIKTPGPEQSVRLLSGGNQQKVVLAKWLARENKVLIFDEPTQGVDVHAKTEMFDLIQKVVSAGKSAIVISSDFSELVSLCHRVVIMREGALVGEIKAPAITEPAIVALAYADAGTIGGSN